MTYGQDICMQVRAVPLCEGQKEEQESKSQSKAYAQQAAAAR
jgi:hypothetical protein